MDELKKYVEVFDFPRVNELAEQGYTHTHTTMYVTHDDASGRIVTKHGYIMKLKTSIDLAKHERFINIPIGDPAQEGAEANGAVALANYSKHITWAFPKETTKDEPSDNEVS